MRRACRALLAAVAAGQVAYAYVPERRRVAATRAIVGLLLAASTTEAMATRGPRRGAALVAGAGGMGFASELLGTTTGRPFGHYHYEGSGLGPQVRGVPLLAAAAWAMMARPAWVAAGWVDARPARRVPLAAAALTAWDVALDPRMVREGYWTWPGGGRYEGVPASNFAGWLAVGALVFAAWAVAERDAPPPAPGAGDEALALYAWTWIGEVFANTVIWRRPRVAVASGLAMGAVAAPALRARITAGRIAAGRG